MTQKPNMTVTARHFHEKPPLAVRAVRSPYPNPPQNREAIGRLWLRGPSPKLAYPPEQLAHTLSVSALTDAVFFLDTNVLSKDLHPLLWEAFRARRIVIAPRVFSELKPWLSSPFANKNIRNDVVSEVNKQIAAAKAGQRRPEIGTIDVLLSDRDEVYERLGYRYYFELLALRKFIGPLSQRVLTKQLGREPFKEELAGYLQKYFGSRGLLLARKGLDGIGSPNKLTDESLVVIAVLTAILDGTEVFIVTRDADVLEQYVKLVSLMKEHYRAMRVAEQYSRDPATVTFVSTPVLKNSTQVSAFTDEFVMQLITTDDEFHPLPAKFHCVNIYCVLLGGETSNMKVTWCNFCAETEMSDMLQIKAATNGRSTDKFGSENCTILTEPFIPGNHRVVVSIGNETEVQFGPQNRFFLSDLNNVLFPNELRTEVYIS